MEQLGKLERHNERRQMLKRCTDIAKVYLEPCMDKPAAAAAFESWINQANRQLELEQKPFSEVRHVEKSVVLGHNRGGPS